MMAVIRRGDIGQLLRYKIMGEPVWGQRGIAEQILTWGAIKYIGTYWFQ